MVRGDAASRERIPDAPAANLGQMDVVVGVHHVPEDGASGNGLLSVRHRHGQMEVLEDAAAFGFHRDGSVIDVVHLSGDDRIHGRSCRRGDIDAVMEEEGARALQTVREHRVEEPRARIAEVRPNRMLLVKRLDRPRIGRRRRARAQRQTDGQKEDSKAHGS